MKRLFETDSTMEDRFGKCPYATAQSLISGKWAVLIMHYLEDGPIRFNDLLRLMPKMTHAYCFCKQNLVCLDLDRAKYGCRIG